MSAHSTAPSVSVVVRGKIPADPADHEGFFENFGARIAAEESDFLIVVSADHIKPHDFARIVSIVETHPDSDMLYGDEEVVNSTGARIVTRPDFSPERLRCQFYLGTVVVYRSALLRSVGGLRARFVGASVYDLALRASRAAERVFHVREVLLSTPTPDLGTFLETDLGHVRTALTEHLAATGGGTVEKVNSSGVHRTTRPVRGHPLVSIIIPTRGVFATEGELSRSLVLDAVRSVVEVSTYRSLEIVVVYDTVADDGVLAALREIAGERLVLVEWAESFNFSSKINLGVVRSRGDFVLILNDDVHVITPDWIERLLALAELPSAGMSGCMLYYDDETIQHAGHHYWQGDATHIGMFMKRGEPGPLDGYKVEREVLGVTAACAMMPREVYFAVGGMTSLLPGAFNDVDLCMKVVSAGYGIYWTPYAELYHFESKTRDASVQKYEVDTAWGRWASRMHDPRYWPYPV